MGLRLHSSSIHVSQAPFLLLNSHIILQITTKWQNEFITQFGYLTNQPFTGLPPVAAIVAMVMLLMIQFVASIKIFFEPKPVPMNDDDAQSMTS